MVIPTMSRMVKVYVEAATIERLKCGRPNVGTVENTLCGVRAFRKWLNERRESLGYERFGFAVDAEGDEIEGNGDSPLVSVVKPQLVRKYLADMLKHGMKPITAMSYLNQLRQLFAKWVRPYYEDRGWKVPPFPAICGRPKAPRYQRPSPEVLAKVKRWYEHLDVGGGLWFCATMMLEFAMRNSDVLRLKRTNFVAKDEALYLNYTPHKTEFSSGRVVKWPVHPDIAANLVSSVDGEIALPDFTNDTFRELNRQMRGLGFTGSKGAYELRKICVDHVYQKYGAEMATSISGDDIKTIIHYYADPAQPNVRNIRVIDLI